MIPRHHTLRPVLVTLAIVLSLASVTAQAGTFARYGTPCRNATPLAISGVPKIGTTFTVSGIGFPGACTFRFCGCTVGNCNSCSGSVLFLGASRIQVGLPGGCTLLNSAEMMFFGQGPQKAVAFPIPNNPALVQLQFYLQRIDLGLVEVITPSCTRIYQPVGFTGGSEGVTGTIGL